MLQKIDVKIAESIVINELCEWNGRQNLEDLSIRFTPVVSTEYVDAVT